jgi:hypothetical protein
MIAAPLLQCPLNERARRMLEHMTKLDQGGAVPTTNIRTLLTTNGPWDRIIIVRLPMMFTTATEVLVTACAEVTASATPSGARVIHRLLIIPGHGSWHMVRVIPSPDAIGEDQVVTFTRLESATGVA